MPKNSHVLFKPPKPQKVFQAPLQQRAPSRSKRRKHKQAITAIHQQLEQLHYWTAVAHRINKLPNNTLQYLICALSVLSLLSFLPLAAAKPHTHLPLIENYEAAQSGSLVQFNAALPLYSLIKTKTLPSTLSREHVCSTYIIGAVVYNYDLLPEIANPYGPCVSIIEAITQDTHILFGQTTAGMSSVLLSLEHQASKHYLSFEERVSLETDIYKDATITLQLLEKWITAEFKQLEKAKPTFADFKPLNFARDFLRQLNSVSLSEVYSLNRSTQIQDLLQKLDLLEQAQTKLAVTPQSTFNMITLALGSVPILLAGMLGYFCFAKTKAPPTTKPSKTKNPHKFKSHRPITTPSEPAPSKQPLKSVKSLKESIENNLNEIAECLALSRIGIPEGHSLHKKITTLEQKQINLKNLIQAIGKTTAVEATQYNPLETSFQQERADKGYFKTFKKEHSKLVRAETQAKKMELATTIANNRSFWTRGLNRANGAATSSHAETSSSTDATPLKIATHWQVEDELELDELLKTIRPSEFNFDDDDQQEPDENEQLYFLQDYPPRNFF